MPVAFRRRVLPKASPESDPRFRRAMEQLKQGAARTKAHPPARKKALEAGAAAKGPPNERMAAGQARQIEKIEEAPAKKPEKESFLSILRAQIQEAMPKTLGDTENFMKGGSSGALKGSLKGNVNQQKDEAAGGVKSASKEQPKEAGTAKDVKPIPPEPGAPAPAVDGPGGMPAPKPDSDVSLQDSKQDADAQMKEAEVTPEQCQKANDPRFSAVLGAKDAVGKQADAAPGQYRSAEKVVAAGAAGAAKGATAKGAVAIVGVKGHANSTVLTKQQQAKQKDEQARQKVVAQIEAVYNKTKASVEAKLANLETETGAMFDAGTDAALKAMTDFVESRISNYKLERYLMKPFGAALWIKDQFMGLPDEVNAFYEQGRALFTRLMDALVVRVAGLVERKLKEAKDEVKKGQAEIQKVVDAQPKELRGVAESAQKDVAGRFEELERGIEEKKNALAQQLASKYKEAFDKANDALKKIQDENKGLVQALAEKIGEIIKILAEFKAKLMGLLKKGADTIKLILADPIGFLGNLIAAIKLGLNQFIANIWTHLKKGFFAWLFGALAESGIEIPSGLPSLPAILQLVLSVLGITYERMRAKAVKLIGERAVTVIETLAKYVKTLIEGGPAKLWEQIKSDLSDLKGMVIDAIQSYIVTTVAQRAIAKLVTLFNPVGAIVQAVLAIYDTVMFFIEKASQIMALVEAVINSVSAIATGAIGGAANWIEQALARFIPVVIGFLAQFVGLGKISKKIKEFIQKVQAKVDAAIDKAIAKVVAVVKKLVGKLTGKGKKDDKPDERTDAQKESDLKAAVAEAKALPENKRKWPFVNFALKAIKAKYKLTELSGTKSGGVFQVQATINPSLTFEMIFESEMAKAIASKAAPEIEGLGPNATDAQAQAIVESKKSEAFASAKEAGDAQLTFEQTKVGLRASLIVKGQKYPIGVITRLAGLYTRIGGGNAPGQAIFRNRVNESIYVQAAAGLYAPRYVRRNIAADDVTSIRRGQGMSPTGAGGRTTILQHVIGQKPSPFISTSVKPDIVNPQGETFNKFGQRQVDLSYIAPDNIINLSSRAGQKAFGLANPQGSAAVQALKDAERTGEVLIRGKIPQEAIR